MPFIEYPPEHVEDPCILQLHRLQLQREIDIREAELRELRDELDAHGRALDVLPHPIKSMSPTELERIVSRPGNDLLSRWFSLSYASWLTLPRSLMEAMPDRWQRQMADLLGVWDNTWDWPEGWGCRVQVTQDNKMIKNPDVLMNYRHPRRDEINALRRALPPNHTAPCGDSHCPHCGWK